MGSHFPRRFGKYLLLRPMAKGGMGEIYMAALGQIGGFEKLCVIKKVLSEKSDPSKAKRFLDEAKVVLRLSHSTLVNTFDAGEVDGEFYIAMEMVEGKDLREVWNRCVRRRQRIPIEVALHVAREVARGLTYVHGYGELKLVHRDIAPPNIMLAYNGDVKLTDFGLARSELKEEKTQPGVVFGRAAYLAPEQARGEVADARTDVYTLAIVLWELLTGHQYLPISGLDPGGSLALVRHPKPTPPSSRAPWISPDLDKVVLHALHPDRQQRTQSADEFRLELSEVIAKDAPRTDPARVVELMQAIFEDVIDNEREEREHFLKEVIPVFQATTPESTEAAPATLPLESLAAAERNGRPLPPGRRPTARAKTPLPPRPPTRETKLEAGTGLPGVTPTPDTTEQRRVRREAAMRVLGELAAEEAEASQTPAPARKA
ncbi:MAG TPA: serine/threonine-protein kinase [Polyangia bacterium]